MVTEPHYMFDAKELLILESRRGPSMGTKNALVFVCSICLISGLLTVAFGYAVLAAILFALMAGSIVAIAKKRRTEIVFTKDAIKLGGFIFLLKHVTSVGYNSPALNWPWLKPSRTFAKVLAAARGDCYDLYVYITYGTKRVPIINGLSSKDAPVIYGRICSFLSKCDFKITNDR